jgi:hypothetical protein
MQGAMRWRCLKAEVDHEGRRSIATRIEHCVSPHALIESAGGHVRRTRRLRCGDVDPKLRPESHKKSTPKSRVTSKWLTQEL